MVPVHQLLLNRGENPQVSQCFSFIFGYPLTNLFTVVGWSLWDVAQVSLHFQMQVCVINLKVSSVGSMDGVSQAVWHDSLVNHCLGMTFTIIITQNHA